MMKLGSRTFWKLHERIYNTKLMAIIPNWYKMYTTVFTKLEIYFKFFAKIVPFFSLAKLIHIQTSKIFSPFSIKNDVYLKINRKLTTRCDIVLITVTKSLERFKISFGCLVLCSRTPFSWPFINRDSSKD